ncbi:DNA-3-methyladenine glycosylase I [Desulforegula conservatrix]|uniref:DNA-3-methyladenine glycosylase I n=1 Tax=Desulforegula conservatrix TaxID=153026 RepID=UPI00040E14E4|nr:DNA-3-methyladenine glycosylase I [Desulforegula conservatrix]
MKTDLIRCPWAGPDPIYIDYHDKEWGVPVFDDNALFEFLILEGAQAGLSWITVLKKRNSYREAFDNFNPAKIAEYDNSRTEALLNNEGIIRNRKKVESAIKNASAFMKINERHGGFSSYFWRYTEGKQIVNTWNSMSEIPTSTELSEKISKDLKKEGFSFVGPTIIYAMMQAVGMVNDHLVSCFRHAECQPTVPKSKF